MKKPSNQSYPQTSSPHNHLSHIPPEHSPPDKVSMSTPFEAGHGLKWSALCLCLTFFAFFGAVLVTDSDLIFRDAGSFYYPMFEYVQGEWEAGRIPLWNPYENAGVPLLANATSSLFYPVKLMFFLPLPYHWLFKLYTIGHVGMSAVTMWWLARRWQLSWQTSCLAAITYAFSAPILFQIYNVIYIVSAAWLPIGIYFGERLVRLRQWPDVFWVAFVLAMFVLGGDPQMAYHIGILLGLYALLGATSGQTFPDLFSRLSDSDLTSSTTDVTGRQISPLPGDHPRINALIVLLIPAAISFFLTAVQILPTAEFGSVSDRKISEVPTNLWQVPSYWMSERNPQPRPDTQQPPHWYDTLIGNPPPPSRHYFQIYGFGNSPFRLIEFLFPNITGNTVNHNTRWLAELDLEDRNNWEPSLYFGLLPLWLGCLSFFWRSSSTLMTWLKVVVVFSFWASCGDFGLAIFKVLTDESVRIADIFTNAKITGSEVAGPYWLLTMILPGYNQFRFPEKWMVIFGFALALLSASFLESHKDSAFRLLRKYQIVWIGLVLILCGGMYWLASHWTSLLAPERIRNPNFNLGLAWLQLIASWLHFGVAASLLFVLAPIVDRLMERRQLQRRMQIMTTLFLVFTMADLCFANQRWVLPTPHKIWHRRPATADMLLEAETYLPEEQRSVVPIRFFRDSSQLAFTEQNPEMLTKSEQTMVVLRDVIGHMSSLEVKMCNLFTPTTININAFEAYFDFLRSPDNLIYRPRRALDAWGARYFLLSTNNFVNDPHASLLGLEHEWIEPRFSPENIQLIPGGQHLPDAVNDPEKYIPNYEKLMVLYNPQHFPHAWVVHDVDRLDPIDERDRKDWLPLMESIVYPYKDWIDLSQEAIVETQQAALTDAIPKFETSSRDLPPEEKCRVLSYEPSQVVIEAHLKEPGLVVVADSFYPGWKLNVTNEHQQQLPAEILRTNRAMRGVSLPAGRFELTFSYHPNSFWNGALISALAWPLFILGSVLLSRKRMPLKTSTQLNSEKSAS